MLRKGEGAFLDLSIQKIAVAFDRDDLDEALRLLCTGDAHSLSTSSRLVLLGLWRRAYGAPSEANGLEWRDVRRLSRFFEPLERALRQGDFWPLMDAAARAEPVLGGRALSRILTTVLWSAVLTAPFGAQYEILTRSFLGGDTREFRDLFARLLEGDPNFTPDYWQVQSLIRTWAETAQEAGEAVTRAAMDALIARTKRDDLTPLMDVFLLFAAQTDADLAFKRARALQDPLHKARVASYLLGASQTTRSMAVARDVHRALTQDTDGLERDFMEARVAVNEGAWARVQELTGALIHNPSLRNEAICLRAIANAHLGDFDNAKAAISHVRNNANAKYFLKARADLINVTQRLLQDARPLPNDAPAPELSVLAGRPLAQSLWVGPRLRWIEEMSIRSYLANGCPSSGFLGPRAA